MDAIQPALILAFLSSIYNLLTALIIDPITGRTHKPNRELFGLGVGNIVAGLIGGLPGAASAPCSLLAARSGGRTAVTGVVCAAVLLAVLFGLGSTLAWIPNAAFAGILIKVGWDMMDIRFLRRIPRLSADIGIVTLLTAALSIFVDVISAIAVGFFIAGMANALRSERQELNQTISTPLLDMVLFPEGELPPDADPFRARVGLLSLRGSYSIASAREIVRVISPDLADHEVVIFDFSETAGMDDSAAMALEELINGSVLGQDKGCIVAGLSGDLEKSLTSLGIFDRLPQDSFAADLDGKPSGLPPGSWNGDAAAPAIGPAPSQSLMSAQPSDSTPTTSERWNERRTPRAAPGATSPSTQRRDGESARGWPHPFSVSSFESSYTFCAFIQNSGDCSKYAAKAIAVSAVTPRRSCTISRSRVAGKSISSATRSTERPISPIDEAAPGVAVRS